MLQSLFVQLLLLALFEALNDYALGQRRAKIPSLYQKNSVPIDSLFAKNTFELSPMNPKFWFMPSFALPAISVTRWLNYFSLFGYSQQLKFAPNL